MPAHVTKNTAALEFGHLAILRQLDLQWEEINESIQARQQQVDALQQRLATLRHLFFYQQGEGASPSERLKRWMDRLMEEQQVIEQLLEQERLQQRRLEQEFDETRLMLSSMRRQALRSAIYRGTRRTYLGTAIRKAIRQIGRFGMFLLQGSPAASHSDQAMREYGLPLF